MKKLLILLLLFALCVPSAYSFTYTMDTTTPAGTDDPTEGDDRIREVKAALVERMQVEHTFPAVGTTYDGATVGYHKLIRLPEQGAAPTTPASYGALYTKDSGTQPELFYREESNGDEIQITEDGELTTPTLTVADMPDGVTIQTLVDTDNTYTTDANANVTFDNNAFLITEGTELLSQAITPTAATNTVCATAIAHLSAKAAGGTSVLGLFNTHVSATNAVATAYNYGGDAWEHSTVVAKRCFTASDLDDTNETTFTVRFGGHNNNVYANGSGAVGSALYGTSLYSSLTLEEIVAS